MNEIEHLSDSNNADSADAGVLSGSLLDLSRTQFELSALQSDRAVCTLLPGDKCGLQCQVCRDSGGRFAPSTIGMGLFMMSFAVWKIVQNRKR